MTELRLWWLVVQKDLRLEFRGGARLLSLISFVVLAGFLFAIAIDRGRVAGLDVVAALIWLTVLFASTASSGRTFEVEEEEGAFRHVLLAPVPRSVIFLGKTTANWVLVWTAATLSFVTLNAFFGVRESGAVMLHLAVLLPGTVGLAAVGTFYGRMSTHSALGDAVLPVLTFPVLVPLIFFGATASSRIFQGMDWGEVAGPVRLLWAFALGALGLGAFLFHQLTDE